MVRRLQRCVHFGVEAATSSPSLRKPRATGSKSCTPPLEPKDRICVSRFHELADTGHPVFVVRCLVSAKRPALTLTPEPRRYRLAAEPRNAKRETRNANETVVLELRRCRPFDQPKLCADFRQQPRKAHRPLRLSCFCLQQILANLDLYVGDPAAFAVHYDAVVAEVAD